MKSPALDIADRFSRNLVSYMAELSERLPMFPGEFRDLCTAIANDTMSMIAGQAPLDQEPTMMRMVDIHLDRLRKNAATKWARGNGTRCDNIKSFTRFLYRSTELMRELQYDVNQDRIDEGIGMYYESLHVFFANMQENNPDPFYDAYQTRKLKIACLGTKSNFTPLPEALEKERRSVDAQKSQEVSDESQKIEPLFNRRDRYEEHTIIGFDSQLINGNAPADLPNIPEHEIHAVIGRGGMGTVYQGLQPFLDRPVAIKVLTLQNTSSRGDIVERFRREAKILAGLNHPNIVACYQAGITGEQQLYIAMELINGPTLDEFIADKGPLGELEAVEVIHQVGQALRYACDREVIHRDVKAQNILLQRAEANTHETTFGFVPKLVDLGLARYQYQNTEDMQLTMQGELMGTPSVMAPEQFDNPDDVDHRTDIYSLGCVLFFILTGSPPYGQRSITEIIRAKLMEATPDPSKVKPELSDLIVSLCKSMLARKPEERPQDYRELIMRCDDVMRRLERGDTGKPGRLSRIVNRIGAGFSGNKEN
jgi:serine/threonine protein kinase